MPVLIPIISGLPRGRASDARHQLKIGGSGVERHGSASTIITSQLPVKALKESTITNAISDRLTNGSYSIEWQGESIRKFRKEQ
ncbi:hypothetical protein [Sinomicrobium sp. M5D2P9]